MSALAHDTSILKADGSREFWKPEKLRHSLRRAGATPQQIDTVVSNVEQELQEGMTTTDIYRRAFSILRKSAPHPIAARYSLRRALFELGPTGFAFEDFIAEIFRARGYQASVRNIIQGKCVEHEVDLVAYKDGACSIAEAKFHNNLGLKSDIQVALYVQSRFLDLEGIRIHPDDPPISRGMIVTNTKFSSRAIEYATCVGLDLIAWNYPRKGNLQDLIEESRVQPVTALTTLSHAEKSELLKHGTALCKNVIENSEVLRAVGIAPAKIKTVIEESKRLCYPA